MKKKLVICLCLLVGSIKIAGNINKYYKSQQMPDIETIREYNNTKKYDTREIDKAYDVIIDQFNNLDSEKYKDLRITRLYYAGDNLTMSFVEQAVEEGHHIEEKYDDYIAVALSGIVNKKISIIEYEKESVYITCIVGRKDQGNWEYIYPQITEFDS